MSNTPHGTQALAEHFFRQEYAKMVSVITRYFGLERVDMAEDIVQDTLLEAINNWEYKGVPANPSAWLYTVAKNKAINALKKLRQEEKYQQQSHETATSEDISFSEEQIADDQLRMMFACCHPAISEESQISLMLKTLCGLSIGEIARAYLTSNETINKRLVRARKTLKEHRVDFSIPDTASLNERLSVVLKSLLLLFNEGYSASRGDKLIRFELCLEAVRLAELICNHPQFRKYTDAHALLSLMLLNAARFEARLTEHGEVVRMQDQDRTLWNQQLINRGLQHLEHIKSGNEIGLYHILATISAYHNTAAEYGLTNWAGILELYEILVTLDPSPLVQLNKSVALAKVKGPELAIRELLALESEIPKNYYHFHSTIADLYFEAGDYSKCLSRLEKALSQVEQGSEKKLIEERIRQAEQNLK